MAVKRDVQIPAVEHVEMGRVGKILRVERDRADACHIIEVDQPAPKGIACRAMTSPDPAGDEMRPEVVHLFSTEHGTWRTTAAGVIPSTWTTRDWLWTDWAGGR